MMHRGLMLCARGMGKRWIRDVWSPFREHGRITFTGLVNVHPVALREASDWSGLPESARVSNSREAPIAVEDDFCCVVTPPDCHGKAVELTCARDGRPFGEVGCRYAASVRRDRVDGDGNWHPDDGDNRTIARRAAS